MRITLALLGAVLLAAPAVAHEARPGLLQLEQTGAESYDVLWKVPAAGEGFRLALDVRMPDETEVTREPVSRFVGGSYVTRWAVSIPGGLEGHTIHIDGLRSTQTDVLARIEREDGSTQITRVDPTTPSFEVVARPGPFAFAATYVAIGIEHILLGVDHLLFVLGLLLIVPTTGMLVKTITAFTVAHSLTLAAATFGLATVPVEPLNATIALSIFFLGPEIVRRWRGGTSLTLERPWLVAFAFGLLHGFGFASGLQTIGIPRGEIVLGLLWFNVGVEIGQVGFVLLVLALVRSFRALEMEWSPAARRIPGYVVGSCGAWWTIDRVLAMLAG
ncbi:MAG: HupE/UreJ family protein [Planctomycetota bacterium]